MDLTANRWRGGKYIDESLGPISEEVANFVELEDFHLALRHLIAQNTINTVMNAYSTRKAIQRAIRVLWINAALLGAVVWRVW